MVRLVKGAYWDTEIKRAQVLGLDSFPVFTRKAATDVSYIANARKLLGHDRPDLSAIRHPQRPYRRRDPRHGRRQYGRQDAGGGRPRRLRVPAPARDGRAAARHRPCRATAPAAGSTPRWARIATCWPISSGGCWRTAPTPPSSTRSSTRRCRRRRSPAVPSLPSSRCCPSPPTRPSGAARSCSAPRGNSRGWDLTDTGDLAAIEAARERLPRPRVFHAAPMIAGTVVGTAPATAVNPARPDDAVGRVVQADAGGCAGRAGRGAAVERAGGRARGGAAPGGGALRGGIRRALRAARPRGRQVAARRGGRAARGGGFPALLRRRRGSADRPGAGALRLHQPLELPARHLHRPDRRGAGRRQRGARQAGRADAADRRAGGAAAAPGRRAGDRAATASRRRGDGGRGADLGPADRRRRLHRLDRDRAGDPAGDGRRISIPPRR